MGTLLSIAHAKIQAAWHTQALCPMTGSTQHGSLPYDWFNTTQTVNLRQGRTVDSIALYYVPACFFRYPLISPWTSCMHSACCHRRSHACSCCCSTAAAVACCNQHCCYCTTIPITANCVEYKVKKKEGSQRPERDYTIGTVESTCINVCNSGTGNITDNGSGNTGGNSTSSDNSTTGTSDNSTTGGR